MKYITREAYLSGNVRTKLKEAEAAAQQDPCFETNVAALKAVIPEDIPLGEIEIRLGAPWIPAADLQAFCANLLGVWRDKVQVYHSPLLASWQVKTEDGWVKRGVPNTASWGIPGRVAALELIEDGCNLRDPVQYDYDRQNDRRTVNAQATLAAREKLQQIQERFAAWAREDYERAERLLRLYNDNYNNIVVPSFNGDHLSFPGMSEVWRNKIRPHQRNAVWRALRGNAGFFHNVGFGKTITLIATAMEKRRLGQARKPMLVVQKATLKQIPKEFREAYPNAKLLIAQPEDCQTGNRQALMARIAASEWDAVIISHESFGLLPLKAATEIEFLREELEQIEAAMADLPEGGVKLMKELERHKKRVLASLSELKSRKDDGVTFEELGVDCLLIDEFHRYKHLFRISHMSRVAGLPNGRSQRATDCKQKMSYLERKYGTGRLVVATGTCITNSMAELYTLQRFLQPQALQERSLSAFDAWASNFGVVVTGAEIKVTGQYEMNSRFSKFVNLPELMQVFRLVADIQTDSAALSIKVPEVAYRNLEIPASSGQLAYWDELVQRAEACRSTRVEPGGDNMLVITGDGRKSSLDLRLVDPLAENDPESKVNQLIANVFRIWREGEAERSTQLIFCDLSTPNPDKDFTVYSWVQQELLRLGVPASEFAIIHDYEKMERREELFAKLRTGEVRILMGSTEKMGVGVNVQTRLADEHHLDAPWRPSDLEQREGRMIRQGNRNDQVRVWRYITQGRGANCGFDAYLWQTLENKLRFIAQVLRGDTSIRVLEEDASTNPAFSYAQLKAIASGDPLILEKVETDNAVAKLEALQAQHVSTQHSLKGRVRRTELEIRELDERLVKLRQDAQAVQGRKFALEVQGQRYAAPDFQISERCVGQHLSELAFSLQDRRDWGAHSVGSCAGLKLVLVCDTDRNNRPVMALELRGALGYDCPLYVYSYPKTLESIRRAWESVPQKVEGTVNTLENLHQSLRDLKGQIGLPFAHCEKLAQARALKLEIDRKLGLLKDELVFSEAA